VCIHLTSPSFLHVQKDWRNENYHINASNRNEKS
jgi:hypothetical protein